MHPHTSTRKRCGTYLQLPLQASTQGHTNFTERLIQSELLTLLSLQIEFIPHFLQWNGGCDLIDILNNKQIKTYFLVQEELIIVVFLLVALYEDLLNNPSPHVLSIIRDLGKSVKLWVRLQEKRAR